MKKAVLIGAVLMLALPAMAQEPRTVTQNAAMYNPSTGITTGESMLTWTVTEDAGMYKIIGTVSAPQNVMGIDAGTASAPGFTAALVDGTSFYQSMIMATFPTPGADVMGIASPAVDTHFLLASNVLIVVPGRELTEDNDGSLGGGIGWGTYLSGTLGISPAGQNTTLDFVQFYATEGLMNYSFEVSFTDATKSIYTGTLNVPEPTTIALLGLGAVGLLRRRRAA
jgi:hypothetical protein